MVARQNILIVDDDQSIAYLLQEILHDEGYECSVCTDAYSALENFKANPYDLALLDIMMPELDGYELCRQLRTISNIPIIFITAKNSCTDKVSGLMIGADDYVTKPFEPYEVIARVKAHLRRVSWDQNNNEEEILFENISLYPSKHTATLNDISLELTPTEFAILEILIKHPDTPHSVQEIFESVWREPYDEAGGKTTMVHMRRLRKKINDIDSSRPYIITIWGVGYKMQA